jgi:hypothetical protein
LWLGGGAQAEPKGRSERAPGLCARGPLVAPVVAPFEVAALLAELTNEDLASVQLRVVQQSDRLQRVLVRLVFNHA